MLRLISIISLLLILTSCSPKYACKDRVDIDGEKCDPITTVYEKKMIGKDGVSPGEEKEVSPKKKEAVSTREKTKVSSPEDVETVRNLSIEDEKPLRLPPRVVRIWVAPWEDMDGDLHQNSYIYSEISPKRGRWLFGEKELLSTQPMLHPLGKIGDDSRKAESDKKGKQEKQGEIKEIDLKPKPQAPQRNIQPDPKTPK
ncbi:MAG: type IV conjugative transfer system lipoprotein TraV [Deltaproteobacteria bacterium]|nr:type IV conjugative transfer system lipoprotein TraV [Deltaproteobacteria bacterium]